MKTTIRVRHPVSYTHLDVYKRQALTSQKNITKDFGYSFNANYATNTNEVKALGPGNAPIISTGSVDHAYYITKVGEPIGCYLSLIHILITP